MRGPSVVTFGTLHVCWLQIVRFRNKSCEISLVCALFKSSNGSSAHLKTGYIFQYRPPTGPPPFMVCMGTVSRGTSSRARGRLTVVTDQIGQSAS